MYTYFNVQPQPIEPFQQGVLASSSRCLALLVDDYRWCRSYFEMVSFVETESPIQAPTPSKVLARKLKKETIQTF